MKITPPAGYEQIAPLQKHHRVSLPASGAAPAAFGRMHAMPVSLAEFAPASRDYPLVFIRQGDGFAAVAALGLQPRQNLFVLGDGLWDRRVYLPAYVRRYPFCMTRVTVDGREQPERIACVEKRAINDKGEALYNAKGEELPGWVDRKKLLLEYEADLARSDEMSRTLAGLGLLENFTMQAVPNEGAPLAMTGLFRVAEEKLNALAPDQLKNLAQKGILARVYAHLVSLANFGRLLDRRAAGIKPAAAPARERKKPG